MKVIFQIIMSVVESWEVVLERRKVEGLIVVPDGPPLLIQVGKFVII